jgi:hypothetical protein
VRTELTIALCTEHDSQRRSLGYLLACDPILRLRQVGGVMDTQLVAEHLAAAVKPKDRPLRKCLRRLDRLGRAPLQVVATIQSAGWR